MTYLLSHVYLVGVHFPLLSSAVHHHPWFFFCRGSTIPFSKSKYTVVSRVFTLSLWLKDLVCESRDFVFQFIRSLIISDQKPSTPWDRSLASAREVRFVRLGKVTMFPCKQETTTTYLVVGSTDCLMKPLTNSCDHLCKEVLVLFRNSTSKTLLLFVSKRLFGNFLLALFTSRNLVSVPLWAPGDIQFRLLWFLSVGLVECCLSSAFAFSVLSVLLCAVKSAT